MMLPGEMKMVKFSIEEREKYEKAHLQNLKKHTNTTKKKKKRLGNKEFICKETAEKILALLDGFGYENTQQFFYNVIFDKKLFPCVLKSTLKISAIVAAISAKVFRVPRLTPARTCLP